MVQISFIGIFSRAANLIFTHSVQIYKNINTVVSSFLR